MKMCFFTWLHALPLSQNTSIKGCVHLMSCLNSSSAVSNVLHSHLKPFSCEGVFLSQNGLRLFVLNKLALHILS